MNKSARHFVLINCFLMATPLTIFAISDNAGTTNGAFLIGNVNTGTTVRAGSSPVVHNPGPPSGSWAGGGNATIQFDSCALSNALATSYYHVISFRELTY